LAFSPVVVVAAAAALGAPDPDADIAAGRGRRGRWDESGEEETRGGGWENDGTVKASQPPTSRQDNSGS